MTRARARGGLAALALAALLPAGAARAEEPGYREATLEIPRKRAGVLFGRFDRDERLDLVVVGESDLSLRLQDDKGNFGDPIELALGKELGGALIDVADLDKDGVDEIVALHRTGVDRYAFDPKARRFVRMQPPLIEKQRGIPFLHLAHEEFLYDIDGDGDRDIAFPVNGRVYVYAQEDGKFVRRGEVETERALVQLRTGVPHLGSAAGARIQIPRLRIEKTRPQSVLELKLGDGRADVLRLVGQQMEIYPSRPEDPPPIDLASASGRALLGKYELYKLVQRILFEKPRRDISIDGAMTLANDVVSTMQGAVTLGREPAQRIAVPAEAAKRVDQILTRDLNGDGRDDILLYVEPNLEPKAGVPLPEKQTLLIWFSQSGKVASAAVPPERTSRGTGAGAAADTALHSPRTGVAPRPAPSFPATLAARGSS